MAYDKYHHGDLKQKLIDNGLILLKEEGIEGLSLRKVAKMCEVSHTAPYKHFKDKEALINEIIKEIWGKFYLALHEVTKLHKNNAKMQLVEMAKAYTKFMVENPEYLKFMFLSDKLCSVSIEDRKFFVEDAAFELFKNCAENFFNEINLSKELYLEKTLAMWSLIHGLTILIVQKSLKYDGDYLQLVEKVIANNI